jgi:molecular chaperone GrpE (heat shock protein)
MHPSETIDLHALGRDLRQDLANILSTLFESAHPEAGGAGARSFEKAEYTESEKSQEDLETDPDRLKALKGLARTRIEVFKEQLQNWHLSELAFEKEHFSNLTTEDHKWRQYFDLVLDLVNPMSAEVERFAAHLDGNGMTGLPESFTTKITNRKENLDIIAKMIHAIPPHDAAKAAGYEPIKLEIQESLSMGDLHSLPIMDGSPEAEEGKTWDEMDKERFADALSRLNASIPVVIKEAESIREANLRQITALEDKIGKSKKSALDFIKRSLLAVVDGVERGAKQWELLKTGTNPGSRQAQLVQQCISAHYDLENALFQHLETIDIYRLVAVPNQTFDVDLHNPVYIEETSQYEDGAVSEMTRSGYRFKEELLRPADVVVARKKATLPNDA